MLIFWSFAGWAAMVTAVSRAAKKTFNLAILTPLREAVCRTRPGLRSVTGHVIEDAHLEPRLGHHARPPDPILDFRRPPLIHVIGNVGQRFAIAALQHFQHSAVEFFVDHEMR